MEITLLIPIILYLKFINFYNNAKYNSIVYIIYCLYNIIYINYRMNNGIFILSDIYIWDICIF